MSTIWVIKYDYSVTVRKVVNETEKMVTVEVPTGGTKQYRKDKVFPTQQAALEEVVNRLSSKISRMVEEIEQAEERLDETVSELEKVKKHGD
jgi:hypothetical protein